MFRYVNEEPGLGPDPLCEELISVGGRWGGQIRSVLCSAEGSTRMDNYVYFRDNCIFHKDFIILSSNQYGRYPRSDKAFYDY